jgi:hypothetical protein
MLDLEGLLEELHEEDMKRKPEVISSPKSGWGLFSDEIAWFLYDFFRFKLNGYEKIMFYSYYINGLTMEELAAACDKTHQAVSLDIIKINKKLHQTWNTKDNWRVTQDECRRPSKRDRPRD